MVALTKINVTQLHEISSDVKLHYNRIGVYPEDSHCQVVYCYVHSFHSEKAPCDYDPCHSSGTCEETEDGKGYRCLCQQCSCSGINLDHHCTIRMYPKDLQCLLQWQWKCVLHARSTERLHILCGQIKKLKDMSISCIMCTLIHSNDIVIIVNILNEEHVTADIGNF